MVKIADYLSLQTLSKTLVGLIVFFSSTQLGLHFWPDSSLVYGVRVDYLAPTIYLFDLLLLSYLITRRPVLKRKAWLQAKLGSAVAEKTDFNGALTRLLPILLVNLLYSQNPLATLSWSLRLLLYSTFLLSVSKNFLRPISFGLLISLLFQSLLAFVQVALGHGVGGLLYYLGERSVSVGAPGIALGTFMGEVVLRAYGTFGHPNVLAGWAVIALLILLYLRGSSSQAQLPFSNGSDPLRSTLQSPRPVLKRNSRLPAKLGKWSTSSAHALEKWLQKQSILGAQHERRVFIGALLLLTCSILFLTQSRAAALSLFGVIIPLYLIQNFKLRLFYFLIPLLLMPSLFSVPTRSDTSLSERLSLQNLSLSVIRNYPVFGTGASASISTYQHVSPGTRLFQPDHNSLTLIVSWFGLAGVLAILYLIWAYAPTTLRSYDFFPLLPLLLLDHYLLTSPQGLFILLLYTSILRSTASPAR